VNLLYTHKFLRDVIFTDFAVAWLHAKFISSKMAITRAL